VLPSADEDGVARLLAEQIAYYRARAPEYELGAIPGALGDEPKAALEAFGATGAVLELACGQGVWTSMLLRHADTVTALDASPEMLAIASDRVRDPQVTFVQADVFAWQADRRYDVVFFGFWLSHVPLERFEEFWGRVEGWLEPGGRVFFVDDAYRTPDELIYGEESSIVQRRLSDGSPHRIVKVAHEPAELERRLRELGWAIDVGASAHEPFYWGAGGRA
jgi:demethylmenaquinone methyltransferase/2-methoxy-6-polyprenyl-1,4-benzoquinol methylase